MGNRYISEKWIAFYPYPILFLGAIIVLLFNPIAPFFNNIPPTDSSVFIYYSEQILEGKILYKELFDHKGPILYLINIAGLLLGGGKAVGIWFVELVMLFGSLIFIFKSICIYFDRFIALISTLSCLLMFFPLMEGGNTTEEFTIPFISMAMYYLLRFFKYKEIKKFNFAIIAFCCICTLLMKPNGIAFWLAGYLFAFILLLINKNYKELLSISIITIVIFLIVCAPFAIYFLHTGSLVDFKFCYWDFNRAYSDASFLKILVRTGKHLGFWVIGDSPVHALLFIFFIGTIMNIRNLKYKTETCFFIFTIILTCVMISVGKYNFSHYYLLCVPIFAFPYAIVFNFIKKNLITDPKWINCFFILFLVYGSINESSKALYEYKRYNRHKVENLITFIKENSDKTDKITVVGSECWVYTFSGRESVSKYSYQFPIMLVNQYGTMIADSYMRDIINGNPRIIVIDRTSNFYKDNFKQLSEILGTQYQRFVSSEIRFNCWLRKQ